MRAQCRFNTLFLLKNSLSIVFSEHSGFKPLRVYGERLAAAVRTEYSVRLFIQRASCQVIIVILRLRYNK